MQYLKFVLLAIIFFHTGKGAAQPCLVLTSGNNIQTVCTNSPISDITYTVSTGVTGVTTKDLPPGVTGKLTGPTYTLSGTPTLSGVYNYELTSTGTCNETVKGTITVVQPPTTANAGPDQTGAAMCGQTSTTLAGNTPAVGTGLWSIASGSGGNIATPANPTSSFSGSPGTTYSLRWTISNSPCAPSADEVTITFQQYPTTANAGPDQTGASMCGLTNTTLAGNTPVIGTGAWNVVTGAGGVIASPGSPTSSFSGVAGTTYVLRWTISNNPCLASSDEVTITFHRNPTVANAGPDQTGASMCGLTSTTLAGNTPVVGTGLWSIASGAGGSIATPSSPTSAFSGTAGSTYVLRWTISNSPCNPSSDEVTITFNQNPTLVINNPSPVCSPSTVNLTLPAVTAGSTPGLTLTYWLNAGATIPHPTPAASGAGTFYIKGTSAAGCFDIKPVTVIVNPSPVATASNNGPVCTGTPLNLTGGPAGMTTYLWTGPNSFTSNLQSPQVSASATAAMAGVYTLTVTSSNGCQGVAATTAVVNVSPTANAGSGGNECDLNFVFSAVPSVGTGVWTRTGGPGTAVFTPNANSPTATVTVSTFGSYIFTWTETNGTCTSSASVAVSFSQQPVANAGTGGNECDLNFILSAVVPTIGTGVWTQTSGPGTSTFAPNASTPNATVTVTLYGTYTFTWTVVNNNCSAASVVTVNFYQQPVANAGTGGNECDLNFQFSAIPSAGIGTWTLVSGPGTAIYSPNANAPNATVAVSLYGAYIFRWTELNGICTSNAEIAVNFYQQPVANAGPGGNECDLNYVFNAVPSIGTGTWTLVTGPGTAIFSPNANAPNATVTVSVYGTYTFRWTEVNATCTSNATITVNFYQQPVANAGTGGNNCGAEFNLGATPSVGTGTWTRVSGPGTAVFSPNANTPTAKVTISAFGTYVFRWTEVNGTCSSNATVSVTFIQQPSANGGNGGIECDKDFLLNAVPGVGTGTWTKVAGPGNVTFTPNANTPNAIVTVTQFGAYDFAWTVVNNQCSSTDIVRVTFNDLPTVSAGDDVPVCEGGSVQLRATGTGSGSGSFLWSPGIFLNNPNISNPVASPTATTTFTVLFTDQNGCQNSDQVTVEVRERPVANAGPDQTLFFIFESNFEAVLKHSYETGKWTLLSGTGTIADENNPSSRVSKLSIDDNIFLWTVTNGACPAATDTITIFVNDLIIPTLITPNLDGKNDFFLIMGIETLGKTELVIFNRWGTQVFRSDDYDNKWDGVDDKANPLPDDTYFFVLRPEKTRSVSGYVVVRR